MKRLLLLLCLMVSDASLAVVHVKNCVDSKQPIQFTFLLSRYHDDIAFNEKDKIKVAYNQLVQFPCAKPFCRIAWRDDSHKEYMSTFVSADEYIQLLNYAVWQRHDNPRAIADDCALLFAE